MPVTDHVDIDVTRSADDCRSDAGPGEEGLQPSTAARTEHQLGGVLGPGEVEQRRGDVVAEDLVVAAAQGFDERSLRGQCLRVGSGQSVRASDVHGQQVTTSRTCGDASSPANQRLALRTARQ